LGKGGNSFLQFFHATKPFDTSNYFHENVRIYLEVNRLPSIAKFQARVTINGEDYDYYLSKEIYPSANPAYGALTRNITTHYFVNSTSIHTGRLSLHPFLNFLREEGHSSLSGIDYIRFS
jgi:hypothetical protein